MIGTILSAGSSRLPDELILQGDNAILLKKAQFDTTAAQPAISVSGMSISQYPADLEGYYIVQFTGYIHEDWKMAVRDTGAVIFDYVPNNAFIVQMNASVKSNVEALDTVQWVGIYQPAYRISPVLSAAGSARENVTVLLFDAGDNAHVSGEIMKLGGEVVESGGDRMRVRIDRSKISDIAAMNEVSWIEKYVHPVIFNDVAANITGVYTVSNTHGLNGSGQIVAVADTGLDTGFSETVHDDFKGRIASIHAWWSEYGDFGAEDENGHGTHAAGSVLGNGSRSNGQYSGMAPASRLVFQAMQYNGSNPSLNGNLLIPTNLSSLFQEAYIDGAKIHSNSWGRNNVSLFGEYTSDSQHVDGFMWNNTDMLIIFAAGNDGPGSNTVSPPSTSKNAIAVGASESSRFGNMNAIASFSSRGFANDGRIKPDVVAPGTYIISTRSSRPAASYSWGIVDSYYAYSSGTSMATPIVAGTAALVRQYYVSNESISPSAALIKATLINGADNLSLSRNDQGWGRVNLSNSLFPVAPRTMRYHDNTTGLSTSQSWNTPYYVNNNSEPLRVTLVWTDYKGNPAVLNQLVNNPTLNVTTPSGSYYLGNGGDSVNNVEQVELSSPEVGWYNIKIEGTNIPQGPQPFAIVISGAISSYGAPSITGFSPSSPVTDTAGATRTFSITADQTVDVTWFINGSQVQYNQSVTSANYTNTNAAAGAWNVTALANNTNGSDMKIWNWTVEDSVIDSCTTISSPGNYVLNRSIFSSPENTCIYITINDVTFDGQGNTIEGQGAEYSYGVYINNTTTNDTVKNVRVMNWYYGIHIDGSNGSIVNNTAGSNYYGIHLINSINNTLVNNKANSNSYGIGLDTTSTGNMLMNNTAVSNLQWDFISTDNSANNTIINLSINPTISFTGKDIAIKSNSSPPADPSGYNNISKYINITNNSADSWLFLNVSYTESDISGLNESLLRMWKHNDSWSMMQNSGVETSQNYVYANITSFGTFTPMAGSYGANLTVTPQAKTTKTLSNATYYLNLTNKGTEADSYSLTVDNSSSASIAHLNVSSPVNLNSGGSQIFSLNVTNTTSGKFYVNITASSNNDSSKVAHINTTTTIPVVITITAPANNTNTTDNYVNVTATLDNTGAAQLNWQGQNYSMNGTGTSFWKNMTGLLSGSFNFRVYANGTSGNFNLTEIRTVTVNLSNITNVSGAINSTTGNFSADIILISPSGNVTVTIFNGTNATVNGTAPGNITNSPAQINATLTGYDRFAGENLTLDPSETRFIPDIQIRFNYTDAQLTAAGIEGASTLRIRFYNTTSLSWVILTIYTLNQTGQYIIANSSYFGTFALIGTASIPCTTCGGSSNSGGGGGGAGTSGENYSNIELKEKRDLHIYIDKTSSYKFNTTDPIMYVNITGNISAGEVTIMVELLRNTSSIVKNKSVPGIVYKNVNIWVGTSGFATPKNIQKGVIRFRILNSWLEDKELAAGDVRLVKWDGSIWAELVTYETTKDSEHVYYESLTDSFSPFAITVFRSSVPPVEITMIPVTEHENPGREETDIKLEKISGFTGVLSATTVVLVIIVTILAAVYLRKGKKI